MVKVVQKRATGHADLQSFRAVATSGARMGGALHPPEHSLVWNSAAPEVRRSEAPDLGFSSMTQLLQA